ncbi:hypothetical protein VKT23_001998 [Stygiomarasmius scandens]|uniref:Uncharacterized protein n=1 Tax=Marasmiellus scandens TaxID=2682957 RepID=A0ABR1K0V6_9AGAR
MFSETQGSTLRERTTSTATPTRETTVFQSPVSEKYLPTTLAQSMGHSSPTSTLSETPPAPASTSSARLAREASRASLRGVFTPAGTPSRKPIVRSDPSILTCFDPSDKELYDLWAPKR